MKKIVLYTTIIFSFLCFSCDNEPYDGDIFIEDSSSGTPTDPVDPTNPTDPTDPTDPTTPGSSLQLSDYDYTKSFSDVTGNESTFITDFVINSQNQFTAQNTSITFFGVMVNGVGNVIRDQNSSIIELRTTVDGTIINRTTVTYNLNKISQISYEDTQDASENFVFLFSHLNNVTTRTKEGTNFSTKFTFDTTNGKLISRETMENGAVIKTETLSYDADNNLTSSVITGQDANTFIYTYDTNTNPLRNSLNDLYLFSILNDEYDDQYEHWQAMIYSTNNVISVSTAQGVSNLDIQYDANNRIISRDGTLFSSLPNIASDVIISISEDFQYIN